MTNYLKEYRSLLKGGNEWRAMRPLTDDEKRARREYFAVEGVKVSAILDRKARISKKLKGGLC